MKLPRDLFRLFGDWVRPMYRGMELDAMRSKAEANPVPTLCTVPLKDLYPRPKDEQNADKVWRDFS